MQRLFLSLAVVLAIPFLLNALDAKDYVNRGNAWQEKGDYDKAIADYNQAIRLEPNNADRLLLPRRRLGEEGRIRQGHR